MSRLSTILSQIAEEAKTHEFLKTGFNKLDQQLNGGFLKKELIVLGGNSGIGKSYLSGQIFYRIAEQGFNSAYFSLEITNSMITSRLIGLESNIMPTKIQYGLLTPQENEDKIRAITKISSSEDFMDFHDDIYSLDQLKNKIIELNLDFCVIDFAQNIESKLQDEYSRLSDVARSLQKLAKEQNCCILLLSQLSNAVAREGADSNILEFKGSGNIKTVCDLGFIVTRENYIDGQEFQDLKLVLKKNRRGMDNLVFPMRFQFPGGKIKEV